MSSCAAPIAPAPIPLTADNVPERVFDLSTLAELGYGSRHTNLAKIHAGQIPAVKVAGAWKIRASDLGSLIEDHNISVVPAGGEAA